MLWPSAERFLTKRGAWMRATREGRCCYLVTLRASPSILGDDHDLDESIIRRLNESAVLRSRRSRGILSEASQRSTHDGEEFATAC